MMYEVFDKIRNDPVRIGLVSIVGEYVVCVCVCVPAQLFPFPLNLIVYERHLVYYNMELFTACVHV